MSIKSKNINTDKIIKELDKADLDDAVSAYHKIKDHLTKRLQEKAEEHESLQNKYLNIAEEIKK